MAHFTFEDPPATEAPSPLLVSKDQQQPAPQVTAQRFTFEDQAQEPPTTAAPRYTFEDQTTPPSKGMLGTAVDSFKGAAARVAQGVNEGLGAINKGFGLDAGMYDENAAYWEQQAQEAGSSGLPAKVYQGIGAAPAGIAEFVAGVPYAAAKGAAEGYREDGLTGAVEGAALEGAKRFGVGKIFKSIEALPISPLQRAGAMGGTMGLQTGAEGGSAEDIAAATITGVALSVPMERGAQSNVRKNLTREGVQPEIARDLAGRVQETPRFVFEDTKAEPARRVMEITGPEGQKLEIPPDTRPPETIGHLVAETDSGRLSFLRETEQGNGATAERGRLASAPRFTFEDSEFLPTSASSKTDPLSIPLPGTEINPGGQPGSLSAIGRPGEQRVTSTPLDARAHEAASSPTNAIPEPSPAQIEAGNYRKGHVKLHGLDISIENPAGSIRKGIDPEGKAWESQLEHHYGYVKGTVGRDKDHLDVFIKPGIDQATAGEKVYVVNQVDPKTGKFDETKSMIGFETPKAARVAYLANYDKSGPSRIGSIAETTVDGFKQWLNEGNTKKEFPSTRTESARQAAAGTLNQVYPEGSPNIGLAVKAGIARDDTVTIPRTHKDTAGNFTSTDRQVEQRWKEANGLNEGSGLIERGKAFIHRMLSETQHFPELDTASFAGKLTADVLRRFESSPAAAKAKTAEYLHSLTATFGPKKMDSFTRKVILDDLMNEAEKGRELPFGYTVETLKKDHAAVTAIAESHPDIKAAIRRRTDVNKALVMDLVENDLLPVESILKPEALERYQKSGKYEADDINTGYFRHQVLEHANARKWAGVSTTGDVRNKQRDWQKGRQGSEKDINTNFLEAEFEVFSQSMKELATKKALDETLKLNDITPELKAQAKKEGVEDWKTLIPEAHTAWQPEKGSVFYRGQTMPEQIVARFIEENPHFADVAAKFREATILGGKKTEVIIPEGLAKTLDSLRTNRDTATLDTINQKLIGAWKVWTLLSPRRAIKYNLNNMSGDMDVAIAADPAIVTKHFNTAWKNGLNRRAGRAMSKDQIDMLDRGVIDAGISINEIPDINKLPGFSRLKEVDRQTKIMTALRSGDLTKLAPPNLIAKYFDTISGLTQIREGLIREAAYLRAKELLERGKKVYWASKPAEIDALPNLKDKAAKLSRDLIGDYGNLSAHGEKIRSRFIPFWSWMEINSPRYYRLFKNAATQGEAGSTAARMAGVGGRKVAGATLGLAEKVLLTQVLFASVSAFNHLVHPEEEERLGDADRKQLHIILGTRSDGKVMTARFQGAFSDALSWFGLENYHETLRNLKDGKMTSGELAEKMLMATPNKLANASAPFYKLGAELITGKSFYPNIAKPMPIRDKVEHATRFLSLDNEYKAMAGKPTRGYMDSLKGLYLYETDPGEAAYNTTRRLAAQYLEKNGKEAMSAEPTARSNALYYYRQAIKYGDNEAAERYKAEYLTQGGTREGIKKSIVRAHPMGSIPLYQRTRFRQSLSPQEEETLKRGIEWYKSTYETP